MKPRNPSVLRTARWLGLMVLFCELLVPLRARAALGNWTPLINTAPDSVYLMLLLSDGTVLAANNPDNIFNGTGNNWYRLTPDYQGVYGNGKWTTLTSANDTRVFSSSAVLTDGRVFVAGGEYGSGGATAEIFNPLANGGAGSWTYINPPTSLLDPSKGNAFLDAESKVLPGGNVLVAPINPGVNNGTLIYNPHANTWSQGPPNLRRQSEASWVKLADGSILTIDPLDGFRGEVGTKSERYIPSQGQWVSDANLRVNLWANLIAANLVGEIGPAFLLPDGRAFFLGGSGHTAYYTPSGNNNPGTWTQGPDIPQGLVAADAPGAMMVNGKILCAVAPAPTATSGGANFPSPTSFFEFDYTAGTNGEFTQTGSPTGGLTDSVQSQECLMLALPSGGVLYSHIEEGNLGYSGFGSQLYVYHPAGAPLAAGKPTITSITMNPEGSYHLLGTGLNGISEGAAFGDDAQMNSNYPLVRLTDDAGNVYYARTFNWSSTGVQTGSQPVTTDFSLPLLGGGKYSLVVVANGIPSDPVSFDGPVWVNFSWKGIQNGSFALPFQSLASGVGAVARGGQISINAEVQPSASSETMTISKPMTIRSYHGSSTIGQ